MSPPLLLARPPRGAACSLRRSLCAGPDLPPPAAAAAAAGHAGPGQKLERGPARADRHRIGPGHIIVPERHRPPSDGDVTEAGGPGPGPGSPERGKGGPVTRDQAGQGQIFSG